MKLARVVIRNFRMLGELSLEIENDTTVIIGENNAGKSAVLDAIRFSLNRSSGRGSSTISEYDFNLSAPDSDPTTAEPIVIELLFREEVLGEWPEEVTQTLTEIAQLDPESGLNQIHLRFESKYDSESKSYESDWDFLNLEGKALRKASKFSELVQYIPIFYLSALRDVGDQFSSRSQFWGRLLRSIDIPDEKRKEVQEKLESLNSELLGIDARMEQVTSTLRGISSVVSQSNQQEVSVRALPLRPWDLMSKSEVVMKGQGTDSKFPLTRHGQGVQSLAVLFLFQAFTEHMLESVYQEQSEPLLALEEPEAHLHPQAARALWPQVKAIRGQKIITTHSPYFIQNVPFHSIRLMRRIKSDARVFSLPRWYSAKPKINDAVKAFVAANNATYEVTLGGELRLKGRMPEDEARELLKCFVTAEDRNSHPIIRDLQSRANSFIPADAVTKLETYVRRMRGEILFAKSWLLCEGQTEYLLMHRFAEMIGSPLDANGVAVIDYQNNGSPGAFAALARVLGFPWLMFSDGDAQQKKFVDELRNWFFTEAEIKAKVQKLPKGDIEEFVVENGFENDIREMLQKRGFTLVKSSEPKAKQELIEHLRKSKVDWAGWLCEELSLKKAGADQVPKLLKDVITESVKQGNGK